MSARTLMPTRAQPGAVESRRMPIAWLAVSRLNSVCAQVLARFIASWLVMESPPFGNAAAQQQRRSIAFFAVTGLQVFQHVEDVRRADGIGPGQRALRVIDPGAHRQIDVGGRG